MCGLRFEKEITGLLLIDPYNDFVSEGGKLWDRIKGVAEANACVPNMLQLLNAARKGGVRVFYAMHHRYRPGDYQTWKYIAPIQKAAWSRKTFEYGTWGGEFRAEFAPRPGDVVAQEHWGSSGFANTDLDLQLKRHGIHKLIVIGLLAHTCLESTVRYGTELGYDVTVVKDATASFTDEQMHAALQINLPNYASAIVTTKEVIEALSSLRHFERNLTCRTKKSSVCFRSSFYRSTRTRSYRLFGKISCRRVQTKVSRSTTRPRERTTPTRFYSSRFLLRKTRTMPTSDRSMQKGPSRLFKASSRRNLFVQS